MRVNCRTYNDDLSTFGRNHRSGSQPVGRNALGIPYQTLTFTNSSRTTVMKSQRNHLMVAGVHSMRDCVKGMQR